MSSKRTRPFHPFSTAAIALTAALLLGACGGGGEPSGEASPAWPGDLVPPIQGATFSMFPAQLPDSNLAGTAADSQGFSFINGSAGRPLQAEDPVVAVAAGKVLRIDAEHAELDDATRQHLAALADQPGFLGTYARDRLLGRQVWIRHESGHVSRYAHLSAVHPELAAGAEVEQGQVLGLMGRSGLPQAEDGPPAPRLHFELWSEDADRHLGQDGNPLEIHRAIADSFGLDALPDLARDAVEAAREGRMPEGSYPPEDIPDYEFSVDAPDTITAGAPFAIAISWEGEYFAPDDFYPVLGGQPLGVIDAGNGAWILGAMPLESAGEEPELAVAAITPLGTTLAGSAAVRSQAPGRTAEPMEVDAATLERLAGPGQERETEFFNRIAYHSMASWEPEWSQPFIAPLEEGTVVGSFGQLRFHGVTVPAHPLPGITLRVDADPGVRAANSGRVVFAESLPVRGQTIAVSHGGGVVSVYAGLAQIGVEAGALVERDQVIGQASESLQWEMHAAGTPSDPLLWLDKLIPGS
ncbi:MAG: peptidoglycan DD-metalloendopeptidase family protein [Gammaproteobacteria bacterium]|jgi:murein DD-endopeptidase MepM/ murein hydrolase activator NlpD|nr:peptidoglycan DD-metalloendopeptidase family protein [Gammaproteobacteria bacterium]